MTRTQTRSVAWQWASVLALAMTAGVALSLHWEPLAGPGYWTWPWRRIDSSRIVLAMALAAIPFFGAQWAVATSRLGRGPALLLLALSTFGMQLVAIAIQGPGFELSRIVFSVTHPVITSYYTDASALGSVVDALAQYPERMAGFHLHSINKPPGPVLYYAGWLSLLPPKTAAFVGGLVIGGLVAASVPATYGLARRLGTGREASFAAASYMALCPSLILFFPSFDPVWPLATCALVSSWSLALERGTPGWAMLAGASVALAAFLSFGLLVIGFFLAGQGLLHVVRGSDGGMRRLVSSTLWVLATVTGLYAIFYAATGYNPVATFGAALENQARHAATLGRPWPTTVVFDLTDFALGTGWMSFLLAFFWFRRRWRERPVLYSDWMSWLAVAQVGLVAVAGLIPVETARVWAFLLPLFLLPVGLELSQWPRAARVSVYVALWALTVLVGQNLVFLGA